MHATAVTCEPAQAWQQLNRELRVNLLFPTAARHADYSSKLSTVIAGGTLPDIFHHTLSVR